MKKHLGYLYIFFGAAVLFGLAELETQRRLISAKEAFLGKAHADALLEIRQVGFVLDHIYENLRTLAALPSVREIDRHAKNMVGDTHETFQQIYNNLASAVAVSEVYVLPGDFNPMRIDPVTGKPEEPIIMFDELIVDAASRQPAELLPLLSASQIEEIEIEEYKEFQKQIAWLKRHYPSSGFIKGLAAPMISSPSLLTCDNTDFIRTGKDADRKGILLSVPFYNKGGQFAGVVSGIIRDNALKRSLKTSNMALSNAAYGYNIGTPLSSQSTSKYIYSHQFPLSVLDPKGNWQVWVGREYAEFLASPQRKAAEHFRISCWVVIFLLAGTLCLTWRTWRSYQALTLRQNEDLEQKIKLRTHDIALLADTDLLTGLLNRKAMSRQIDELSNNPKRAGKPFVLACLDIDDFKAINDSMGHAAGDQFLKKIADRLMKVIAKNGVAARWGGDEFMVIHYCTDGLVDVEQFAQAIEAEIKVAMNIDGEVVMPLASMGIAIAGIHAVDYQDLIRKADLALYAAKADKTISWCLFEQVMEEAFEHRRWIQNELRIALDRGDIYPYFQPIVCLLNAQPIGFEALARWVHPQRGNIPPDQFIPVAESSNLIVDLGAVILLRSCQEAVKWPEHMTISVNLSGHQLRRQSLVATVANALATSGLQAHRLTFEITETVLMLDEPLVQSNLHQLRAAGIKIALDDFGTGYSSLSYLQNYPIDSIKIDRGFIQHFSDNPKSSAIIAAIIALATKLNVPVIAEGVETEEQRQLLCFNGCTNSQGWLFGKAMSAADVVSYLAKNVNITQNANRAQKIQALSNSSETLIDA